jgi:hypothetical protein
MEQLTGYPVANLQANQLEKVRELENELNQGTNGKIVLIAYQQETSE